MQKNDNTDQASTIQHQIDELKAAKEAHLILAQTSQDDLKNQIELSKQQYTILQRFRRKMIFAPKATRPLYKIAWHFFLTRTNFIFIADYQMVHHYLHLIYIFNIFFRTN